MFTKKGTGMLLGRRLRGIILASSGSTFHFTRDSVTQFQVDVPGGDVFSYNLAEDGILFRWYDVSAISNRNLTVI